MNNLTQAQTDQLKEQLAARYAQLREDIRAQLIRSEDAHYIDLAGRVHDTGEESVADLFSDLDIAIIDREVEEIRRIEAAQLRIAAGTYGICEDCGGDIGIERLGRQPTATRCITCQGQHEKTFVTEGTPRL